MLFPSIRTTEDMSYFQMAIGTVVGLIILYNIRTIFSVLCYFGIFVLLIEYVRWRIRLNGEYSFPDLCYRTWNYWEAQLTNDHQD